MEKKMFKLGSDKIKRTLLTSSGNNKNFSSTASGINMVAKESVRLRTIMINNNASRKPDWYKLVNLEIIASTIYLLGSKISLYDKDIKWQRHSIILKVAEEFFADSIKEGLGFVEWVIDNCKLFVKYSSTANNMKTVTYGLNPDVGEDIISYMNEKAALEFYPLPMEEKPLDWRIENGVAVGGYKTKQYPLVRKGTNLRFISETLLEAINTFQQTPYRINKYVLEAVKRDLKMPLKTDYIEYSKENAIEYYRQRSIYKSEMGKYRAVLLSIRYAELYDGDLYFPSNFDYRGRMYPIPVFLQPQGDDKVKGMLQFRDGVKLTKSGIEYAYFTLAGLWGEDKKSFKERVEIGKLVINNNYKDAEEPYQFLGLQEQMQRWEKDNDTLISIPGHLDACASGSQISSVLTGCMDTALATNVIPSETRRDVYEEVAKEAIKIAQESDLEYIAKCLKENGRKYAKRPTMISIYGGTLKSFADYSYDAMKELEEDVTMKKAFEFAKILKMAIENKLKGGKEFEEWIRRVSKIITSENKGIYWYTPDGFKVELAKKKMKVIKIQVRAKGKQMSLNINTPTDEIDVNKNKNCISPNYIHSMDATHLRMTLLACKKRGVTQHNYIHDSFGTNMNDMHILAEELRKEWVKLYGGFQVCYNLQVQFQRQTDNLIPESPFLGGFNIEDTLKSEYFFS